MESRRQVYFRADADRTIGFGHFIRSLALADMLKDEFDCTFFTQAPTAYQQKEICGICKLIELPADNTKFSLFLDALHGDEIVFLDNYFFSAEYQQLIKKRGCKLVCIGGNDKHYYSDIVINYTDLKQSDFSVENYTKLCLGLDWTILRRPFWDSDFAKRSIPEKINAIAVSFGGTDPFAITEIVIKYLQKFLPDVEIHVIVTDSFGVDRIEYLVESGIMVHTNVSADGIAAIFNSVDVAVLSASSIALEALALHTPVMAGYYIDNQKGMYEMLNGRNYIFGIGDLLEPLVNERIGKCMEQFSIEQADKGTINFSDIRNKYVNLFKAL